jgi:hypothetical protein
MIGEMNRARSKHGRWERPPVVETTEDDGVGVKASTEFDEVFHLVKVVGLYDKTQQQAFEFFIATKSSDKF